MIYCFLRNVHKDIKRCVIGVYDSRGERMEILWGIFTTPFHVVCDKVTPLFTDCQGKWCEDCVKRAVSLQIVICVCFFCGMKVKKGGRRGEGKAQKRDASARSYGLMANAVRCSFVARPRGGRCTAQRRTAHGPETDGARPRSGRCTSQRRTLHVPRSLTGIRDGAAPAWSPTGAKHCSSLCLQSEGREDESAATTEFVALFAIGSSPSLCEQSELQCWRRRVRYKVPPPSGESYAEYGALKGQHLHSPGQRPGYQCINAYAL